MPFVYILRCGDGSLYTGSAKDVARRLAQHASGRASRYTRSRRPVALVWTRRVRSWSRALKEEQRIKALTRAQKEALLRDGRGPASVGRLMPGAPESAIVEAAPSRAGRRPREGRTGRGPADHPQDLRGNR